jgi:hypothetical protein
MRVKSTVDMTTMASVTTTAHAINVMVTTLSFCLVALIRASSSARELSSMSDCWASAEAPSPG